MRGVALAGVDDLGQPLELRGGTTKFSFCLPRNRNQKRHGAIFCYFFVNFVYINAQHSNLFFALPSLP